MKSKIISLCTVLIIILFNVQNSYTADIYDKKLPSKFKKECFKFSSHYTFDGKNNGKNKIILNKADAIAVQWNYLVPIIPYTSKWKMYSYSVDIFSDINFIKDNNPDTYLDLDTAKNKEIILTFDNLVKKNTFTLNFKHSAENYSPEIFISEDGNTFDEVSFSTMYDFDIKKLKIIFSPNENKKCLENNNCIREKIKITELNLIEEKKIKLIKVQWGGKIEFFSHYNCDDYINLNTIHVPFDIDINTPEVIINLEENALYNPNIEKDTDGDNIDNYDDNCEKIFNPLQKDSNSDGVGDRCSDVDNDGIVWHKDNCPTLSNPQQIDKNLNDVWDVCEFDKDKDGIFDSIDNCTTTKNALQRDVDKDGIWDLCDNCNRFNPLQVDRDKNNIGDMCDNYKRFIEKNDDDLDGIINKEDNCPAVNNTWQEDWDKDWIWDACDNCKLIQNSDQLDFNKNKKWDLCEDSDDDWIPWLQDNCINVKNPKQKDSDNDWVGDFCEDDDNDQIWFAIDNCPYDYNPRQLDSDDDGEGNVCDKKDDRLLESNKDIFTLLLVVIVIIFIWWIHVMAQKIQKKKKNKPWTFEWKTESYTKSIKK